jgi:glutathione S-transferase/predicted transcriptional regulator
MATRVWESTVIDAPVAAVWALVRPLDFSYMSTVASASVEGKLAPSEVGSLHVISYKAGTGTSTMVQKLRLSELSDSKHSISWDLVESTPAHHTMSASYSIRLRPITQRNMTFVEWVADFSRDVSAEAVADAVFKAREHFKALAAIVKAKLLAEAANAKIGKNKVSVPELKRQLSAKSSELHKLFTSLDRNNNGVLEFDEFTLAVNKLYGENLPDEAIKMLLREADTNQDNVVSYDEFMKFLQVEHLESKAREVQKKSSAHPALKLHYFNARGRAELARLMLAEADIKYTDERYDGKKFGEVKNTMPFGQVPVLEVGNVKIAQSGAINRYVAKLTGLYGKNNEESSKIDMVYQSLADDLAGAFGAAFYAKDPKEKETKTEAFWAATVPHWAGLLEKQLASNNGGTGYFVGSSATLADFAAYDLFARFLVLKPECLNAAPLLHQLVTRISNRPAVAHWVKIRPVTQS